MFDTFLRIHAYMLECVRYMSVCMQVCDVLEWDHFIQ